MAALTPFEVAQRIVQCAYDAVDHTGALEIKRRGVVPGEIAWDECECGQLVVSEGRRFPSREFPFEELDHSAECGEPWLVVEYTLSLTRCAPQPSKNEVAPDIAKLEVAAAQLMKDKGVVRRAVYCCLEALYNDNSIVAFDLGAQETVGPAGRCVGSELIIHVGWLNGCGC